MCKYTSYERIVLGYLRNYHKLAARADVLGLQMKDLATEIATAGAPKCPAYGLETGGGSAAEDDLNGVEREAYRLIEKQKKLEALQGNQSDIKMHLAKIDRALESLDGTAEQIVRLRYIDGERWGCVSLKTGYTERNCQKIGRKAVHDMADILLGRRAEQPRFGF